jgi:hypothetical protein
MSSSGVVNAILNYTAYDERVSDAVGPKCGQILRNINAAFEHAIKYVTVSLYHSLLPYPSPFGLVSCHHVD